MAEIHELAAAFDLASIEEMSLTRWAPVFRATTAAGTPAVVKRTAADSGRAAAMAGWTRRLRSAGLPVVAPLALGVANPAAVQQQWWVVYPFVDGHPYTATADQVAAGRLLGRLHADPVPAADLGLREYAFPDSTEQDMEADLRTLTEVLRRNGAPALAESIATLGRRWWGESLPALLAHDDELVRTAVSSDYKASNLIFRATAADGDPGPVLVDPDNGGLEPRIFDLALAVVLFHNECDSAPGQLFSATQWETFIASYLDQVELTATERDLWPAALDHMFWEEGSWALEDNDALAWADPRQRAFLLDLAAAGPERYPLP